MVLIQRHIVPPSNFTPPAEKFALLMDLTHYNTVGLLGQIQQLFTVTNEVFSELVQEAQSTSQRIQNLKQRVGKIKASFQTVDDVVAQGIDFITPGTKYANKCPEQAQLYMYEDRVPSMTAQYNNCKPPPNFTPFQQYDETCLKKYSNRDFFLETWIEEERLKFEDAKKKRAERRQQRAKKPNQNLNQRKIVKQVELSRAKYSAMGKEFSESDPQSVVATPRNTSLNLAPQSGLAPPHSNSNIISPRGNHPALSPRGQQAPPPVSQPSKSPRKEPVADRQPSPSLPPPVVPISPPSNLSPAPSSHTSIPNSPSSHSIKSKEKKKEKRAAKTSSKDKKEKGKKEKKSSSKKKIKAADIPLPNYEPPPVPDLPPPLQEIKAPVQQPPPVPQPQPVQPPPAPVVQQPPPQPPVVQQPPPQQVPQPVQPSVPQQPPQPVVSHSQPQLPPPVPQVAIPSPAPVVVQQQPNIPPPPPAPVPPPPPPVVAQHAGGSLNTSAILQGSQNLTASKIVEKPVEKRSTLLHSIHQGVQLKKVQEVKKEESKTLGGFNIAKILERRAAMEYSDEEDENDEEWDD